MKKRSESKDWKAVPNGNCQSDELDRDLSRAVDKSISGLAEKLKAIISHSNTKAETAHTA